LHAAPTPEDYEQDEEDEQDENSFADTTTIAAVDVAALLFLVRSGGVPGERRNGSEVKFQPGGKLGE